MRREPLAPDHDAPQRVGATRPARAGGAARHGAGAALPAPLRDEFGARLGADFSAVRVHTDREAGASALALGARAYSAGRDLVFAPGHYAPHTAAGRELLAHELCHVAQEGVQPLSAGQPLQVDAPGSADEREAEAAARVLAAPAPGADRPPAALGARRGPPRLRRSLLGSLAGGLLGGVTLGLIGAAFGPLGAVVGALVGTVGGLLAGDLALRRERGLSGPERDYLREIYVDSVDYDKVTITRGSIAAVGAARTVGNTIHLQSEHFDGDTMDLRPAGLLVLAHEMGHVWQYQNGGWAYIPSSLIPQLVGFVTGRSRNAAYAWRAAAQRRLPWHEWNAEQQAECIGDYNEALRAAKAGTATPRDFRTLALAQPYIELVRQRIGAPGSASRDAAPGGARAGGRAP